MSEEVETLGEAPPLFNYRLPRRVENYDIYAVFIFRDPPPRVSESAPVGAVLEVVISVFIL